jgi:glycosyltransferase involved in cell wall biosynthesis
MNTTNKIQQTMGQNQPQASDLISIIIPARNEEGNIERLEQELLSVVGSMPFDFEFIVIDNASIDQTGNKVKEICDRDARWKYLRFSRNFTVEMSLTAGYHEARGDAIIVLYSDLQDPPDVIPRFIEKWKEGYDVVYGVRTTRPGDPAWRNFMVKIAYRIIRWFSEVPIPTDAGDFRLITRQVRDALEECGEYNRYLRGLIAWLGFRQIGIPYERKPRLHGISNAPFFDIFLFTINAITSFSLKPLRLFTFMGFIILLVSFLAVFVYAGLWLVGSPPPGITTLIILGFFGIGLNSLGIGILGEYIGRIYAETKSRPKYIIQEVYKGSADRKIL